MISKSVNQDIVNGWRVLSDVAGALVLLELAETNRLPRAILLDQKKVRALLKKILKLKNNRLMDLKDLRLAEELGTVHLTQSEVNSVYKYICKEKIINSNKVVALLQERLPKTLKSRASKFVLTREEIKGYDGPSVASKIMTGKIYLGLERTQSIAYFKVIENILASDEDVVELSENLTYVIKKRILPTGCIGFTDITKIKLDDLW